MKPWIKRVVKYQRHFDTNVQKKGKLKIMCCSAIEQIATAVRDDGTTHKEKFKELAIKFYGAQDAQVFDDWADSDFEQLFEAFNAIFDVDDPYKCHVPDAVRDAVFCPKPGHAQRRIRWTDVKGGPVLVLIYGP